jgi:hypothetical protein
VLRYTIHPTRRVIGQSEVEGSGQRAFLPTVFWVMSVLRASLGARVSCIYLKTCSVYFTVFIKQDVNIEAFHIERSPQVITLMSEEVAKLLRERTGPAFVRWSRIVVDSWWKVGHSRLQVGMVGHPGNGTCVVRGCICAELM